MFERLARTNTGSGFPEIDGESGSAAPSVRCGFASLAGGRKDARNPSTNINKAKATHSQKKICIGGGWRATTSEATVQMSFHSAAIADAPYARSTRGETLHELSRVRQAANLARSSRG
jgi:hypothetical protein